MLNLPVDGYFDAEHAQLLKQPRIDWNIQSVAHLEDWTAQLPMITTLLNTTKQHSSGGYNAMHLEIQAEDIRFPEVHTSQQVDIFDIDAVALKQEFNNIVQRWKQEIGGESSLTRITGNINYLKVIKLGRPAVPLILRELEKEPAPWFLALRVLTDETTVGREHRGNFAKMAEDWISWGKANNII